MKGLLILAALLLVPSMAYFQKQYFAEVLQGQLEEEVRLALIEGGVEEPEVSLVWMDARIGGLVSTSEKRSELGEKIGKMGGVRLAPGRNELRVRGWLELARGSGAWTARGMVPKDFLIGVVKETDAVEGWDAELTRAAEVAAPVGASGWSRFLERYFAEAGDRTVVLRNGRLSLSGEATEELRKEWLAQAALVVSKGRVKEKFELRRSVYHFAGHVPEVLRGQAKIAELRKVLSGLRVKFAEGSVEVDGKGRDVVSTVAGVMLGAGERVRFVVGVSGAKEPELADERMEAVVALLAEYGVGESQLVKQVFGATLPGNDAGQVEFLLR